VVRAGLVSRRQPVRPAPLAEVLGPHELELVDVVDEADRVVGQADRAEILAKHLLHRVVFVVLRSTRGEVLVHRRAETKDLWPGYWDVAVGGVVAAGEAYEDAARRELAEELGVEAELVELASATYRGEEVAHLSRTYEAVHDGPFTFSDAEVVEARFVAAGELFAFAAAHPICPDSAALVMPLLDREDVVLVDAVEPARVGQLLDLYKHTWWAAERSADDVAAMLAACDLVFALVDTHEDRLVAFARVLTDSVYLAHVTDVMVAPDRRRQGLAATLMDAIVGHPRLARVESLELVCQPDLVDFYRRWGFTDSVGASRLMRRTSSSHLLGG
jgi:isopentenyldiphosphate isomerase/GNAT superfamily N-acetyltransferase